MCMGIRSPSVMRLHCLLFLCSVSFVCMSSGAKRSFYFSWTNVTCTNNPNILLITCEILKSENGNIINYRASAVKDIDEVLAHAYIDIIRTKSDNIRIVETNVDGCGFLNGKYFKGASEIMAVTVFKLFQQFGTMPNKCPVEAGKNYSLENMYLDTAYLPTYAPEAVFTAGITLTTKGVVFLDTKLFGRIEQTKNRKTALQDGRRT